MNFEKVVKHLGVSPDTNRHLNLTHNRRLKLTQEFGLSQHPVTLEAR